MTKAIFILDEMPENCLQCQFAVTSEENNSVFCTAAQKDIAESWLDLAPAEWDPENFKKPDWCPLREIKDDDIIIIAHNGGKYVPNIDADDFDEEYEEL